jgi:hypothetical protein
MMVGSWPCNVTSKMLIIGQRVSEPVWKDNGKAMDLNQKMRRTQREHTWCCPRVMRWSGQVTQGC